MKITARTALKTIVRAMKDDFGVNITTSQAKQIREDKKAGAVVWTRNHFISTASNATIQRVDGWFVRVGSVNYAISAWNKQYQDFI